MTRSRLPPARVKMDRRCYEVSLPGVRVHLSCTAVGCLRTAPGVREDWERGRHGALAGRVPVVGCTTAPAAGISR